MAITGLCLQDHLSSNEIASIDKQIFINELTDKELSSSSINNASHVIGHFTKGQLTLCRQGEDSYDWENNVQIIFCMTTKPPGYSRENKHERIEKDGKIRYLFFVCAVNNFKNPDVIQAFYKMDQSDAENLYQGNYDRIPQSILSLFGLEYIVLPMISLLCQTYLIVNGRSEERNVLALMGWDQDGDRSLISQLNLSTLWNEIKNKKEIEAISPIEEKAKNEWCENKYGDINSSILGIVKHLGEETNPSSKDAAQAYISITERLMKG
jgi:hypothetical protein